MGRLFSIDVCIVAKQKHTGLEITLLQGDEFFVSRSVTVAVEPRAPQQAFPEHYHDFWEIVLVEQGAGVHVFNDQPFALFSGAVFFIRDNDRHLFEDVDGLFLTNVLYRSPRGFHFLSDIAPFLPYGPNGERQGQWQVNAPTMQQLKGLLESLSLLAQRDTPEDIAASESGFLQILMLLRQKCFETQSLDGDRHGVCRRCSAGCKTITVKRLTGGNCPIALRCRCVPCTGN